MFDYRHIGVARLSPNAAACQSPVRAQIGHICEGAILRSQPVFSGK
jgi:hypothetical protein